MERPVLRSKHGCWTCRLRKKKCDERRPECSICDSHKITCYGYGPKPEWMDDAAAERAILKTLSQTLRKNARLRIQHRPSLSRNHQSDFLVARPKHEGSSTELALPKTSSTVSTDSRKSRHWANISSHNDRKPRDEQPLDSATSRTELQQDSASRDKETSNVPLSARDSVMLMHFLDSVFSIQYPMYQPRPLDGGRGWLLALLFECEPFYHSALALSSYSRLLRIEKTVSPQCRSHAGLRLEQHLEVCLQQVRQTVHHVTQIASSRQRSDVGTILAVIQLIFIELCISKSGIWRMHLRGAIELYQLATAEDSRHDQIHGPRLADSLSFNFADEGEANAYIVKTSSMRFACASIFWLDAVGSITGGKEPQLILSCASDLGPSSMIQLEEVVGCRNGPILQIARIARLYGRRQGLGLSQEDGTCPDRDIDDIHAKLDLDQNMNPIRSQVAGQTRDNSQDRISIITTFFTSAARIFLHLVTSGFRNLEPLTDIVSATLRSLETTVEADLYPMLVCPLFLLGCALSNERDFQLLRRVFASQSLLHPLFAHREKLISVLEEIWTQSSRAAFSWDDVVDLTSDILLV